ncbi:MAG: RDD family protein [Candidatus Heimdallarchaeota archaeon]|nr:RDD family protein [Candidatus Heimdallarchaeota archaeon]MCK4954731.1 RDD family protein [Candidatus Heimdallarchaeota archaeon]
MSKPKYFCPNCGSPTAQGDRFCLNCGKALGKVGQPPSPSQQKQQDYGTNTTEPYTSVHSMHTTSGIQKSEYHRLKARYVDRCIALLIDGILHSIIFPLWLLRDIIPETGKSFGKAFLKLKVVNYDTGLPISAGQAFIRNIFLYLFGWIDIFIPLFTSDGRRIGDYIANTIVLEDR